MSAESLTKKKKTRAGHKASATRTVRQIDEIVAAEEPDSVATVDVEEVGNHQEAGCGDSRPDRRRDRFDRGDRTSRQLQGNTVFCPAQGGQDTQGSSRYSTHFSRSHASRNNSHSLC